MAPISLKIVQDDGAVTRKVKLDPNITVQQAAHIVKEKSNLPPDAKEYGLFLRSVDNELSGVWMESQRALSYYMLRDGDRLDYACKIRNLRLRMLDDSVKTIQVDQSKVVSELMFTVCSKIGITNHEEYGLCLDQEEEAEENKDKDKPNTGTLTLKKKSTLKDKDPKMKERDLQFEQLSKKLKTDDNVEWVDTHKSLSEACISPHRTLLLKRRLFYSDRNVDSRDPVQLNLLYVQARDNILNARHPVTEDQAADCKVRWINIRDVHRRMLRKSISGPYQPKRYKYDKPLDFMRQFYKEVVTVPSMGDESENDGDRESQTWTEETEAGSQNLTHDYEDDNHEAESKPTRKRKAKSKKAGSSFEQVDVSTVTSIPTSQLNSLDPVEAFLLGIRPTLKGLSPYHLNLAKSKIFDVVQELDLQPDSLSSTSEVPIFYQG